MLSRRLPGANLNRKRMAGGIGLPKLPAGAIHDVDYLATNTTRLPAPHAAHIATAVDRGSVGGLMVSPIGSNQQRRCPVAATVNGAQYGDFSDVAGDAFRDYLIHDGADPSDFGLGGATDGDFTVLALFEVTGGLTRYVCTNMATISASGAGFFARHGTTGALSVGMTPTGHGSWYGLVTSSALADGWHFCSLKWGNGTYAHYVDDMETPFASGSYTHSGSGGNPTSTMVHGGSGNDGVTGLGGVAMFARELNQADRVAGMRAMMARLKL